jgi:hypothetical protein
MSSMPPIKADRNKPRQSRETCCALQLAQTVLCKTRAELQRPSGSHFSGQAMACKLAGCCWCPLLQLATGSSATAIRDTTNNYSLNEAAACTLSWSCC